MPASPGAKLRLSVGDRGRKRGDLRLGGGKRRRRGRRLVHRVVRAKATAQNPPVGLHLQAAQRDIAREAQ